MLLLAELQHCCWQSYTRDAVCDNIRYMMFEMLEEELQTKLHIFSSFFYERLSNSAMDNKALRYVHKQPLDCSIHAVCADVKCSLSERIHNRVKTWTRHVDLFAKEYLVIPVNEK